MPAKPESKDDHYVRLAFAVVVAVIIVAVIALIWPTAAIVIGAAPSRPGLVKGAADVDPGGGRAIDGDEGSSRRPPTGAAVEGRLRAAPPRGATWIFRGDESRRRRVGSGTSSAPGSPSARPQASSSSSAASATSR